MTRLDFREMKRLLDFQGEGRLAGALLTTFGAPDEELLVDDLLPSALGVSRSNGRRQLVELEMKLRAVSRKIVLIGDRLPELRQHQWLAPRIRFFMTGREGRACQHAKLWLVHWINGSSESLEIIITSANLTKGAFQNQIQAAWRECIPLERTSKKRLSKWKPLPWFLKKLFRSAGIDRKTEAPFLDLLARAEPPLESAFVASVPRDTLGPSDTESVVCGSGARKWFSSDCGATAVTIVAPSIGKWTVQSLDEWRQRFHLSREVLKLLWIDRQHPWAKQGWKLPEACQSELKDRLLLADVGEVMQKQELEQRWLHAKLYEFRRARSRRLLLTSANFSPSAWGNRNFELGVLLSNHALGEEFDELPDLVWEDAAVNKEDGAEEAPNPILWAAATLNRKYLVIEVKTRKRKSIVEVKFSPQGKRRPLKVPKDIRRRPAEPPLTIDLNCEGVTLTLPVFDECGAENDETVRLPGISEEDRREILDNLILEEYGGPWAEDEPGTRQAARSSPESGDGGSEKNADYSLAYFTMAREWFRVADCWWSKYQEQLCSEEDGKRLAGALQRRHGTTPEDIGARLAAEEIRQRLKRDHRKQ